MRTIQGRMLLRPGEALNQIVLGVFGRAQKRFEIPIHAIIVMSTHYHVLASPPCAQRLADFMGYVNTNLSKEVGKLHRWKGPMWQRRYDVIPVSEEEAAQVARLRYLLSHGCKENLVLIPSDWPGVHSVDAIVHQKPLKGLWFDRTAEFAARQRGEEFGDGDYAEEEIVELTPLPAWKALSPEAYRQSVAEIVEDIEKETAARHRHEKTAPVGARSVVREDPHHEPNKLTSSPRPRFHAASRRKRKEMEHQFREWLTSYREASDEWRSGNLFVEFPPWSFLPAPRWVGRDNFDPG